MMACGAVWHPNGEQLPSTPPLPTTVEPSGVRAYAALSTVPPGRSPRPTIPPDAVHRNASHPLLEEAMEQVSPTITDPFHRNASYPLLVEAMERVSPTITEPSALAA